MTATLAHPAATDEIGQLPAWASSVVDLQGDLSVVSCRSGTESRIAAYLDGEGLGWFNPRETVRKRYVQPNGKTIVRDWTRAFIPGILFVANGYDGRTAATIYGSRYHSTFRGFIGFLTPGTSSRLLADLVRIENILAIDPTLKALDGIRKGVRVRVTSGPFEGQEGVVDSEGARETMWILLPTLGCSTEVNVDRESLERI